MDNRTIEIIRRINPNWIQQKNHVVHFTSRAYCHNNHMQVIILIRYEHVMAWRTAKARMIFCAICVQSTHSCDSASILKNLRSTLFYPFSLLLFRSFSLSIGFLSGILLNDFDSRFFFIIIRRDPVVCYCIRDTRQNTTTLVIVITSLYIMRLCQ